MFIKKLKLKNFRCFTNLEIDFELEKGNRQRTIILGENGTGKSNILKAIALVTAGSSALGELLGGIDEWIRYKENECRIDLEMTNHNGELRQIWLEIHRGDNLSDIIKRSDESLKEIDSALNHTDRNYFVVGYGASRISSNGGKSRSGYFDSQRSNCIASLLDKNAQLKSIEEWSMDLDYRSDGRELDIVKKVFNDFLPNTKFSRIDRDTRRIMLKTDDGIIPFSSLSDGYQNMAAWIGDLLFRVSDIFRDRKDPMTTRGVLLIDEIALHLHPKWQRTLLKFIGDNLPKMQLIATTHSPFIAQQAGIGELFTIEREKNKDLQLDCFTGNPQELLLHQLIMSDVFGLDTDESVYVENFRKKQDKIENRKGNFLDFFRSKDKLERTKEKIPMRSYTNSLITDKERELMIEVLKKYKK